MGIRDDGESNPLSRREFLVAGVAATGLLATVGFAMPARAQPTRAHPSHAGAVGRTLLHRGKEISIRRSSDGLEELAIEGRPVRTVYLNGAYRAMYFAYSPQPTLEDLGRRMIDYRAALAWG